MGDTRSIDEIAAIVLVDIAVVIVAARLMGGLFRRLRQPAVVGEIVAGILLGPSLLGQLPGHLDERLFPLDVRPYLQIVAQLGLVIFMFIVGLELDLKLVQGKERVAGVISVTSVALPFGLGIALAALLFSSHAGSKGTDFLPFAFFIGASMAVTAFPVLARILTERGMYRTEVGALTLACAAIDDILAWSLLAFVIATVEASGVGELPAILGWSLLYVAGMFIVVKPRLASLGIRYQRAGRLTPNILAVVLVGMLVSAWVTATIGIHQIFGAFLFGVVMPRDATAGLFREILERLESVSVLLLLPVFFIVAGLDADVTEIGWTGMGELGLILVVAISGKFLGAAGAARAQGLVARKAAAVGILMNTRGLTELVILSVGLSKMVIDRDLYTLLVVMAIVTTVMTEPLLRLAYPDRLLARDIADAEKASVGLTAAWRVLVVMDAVADDDARQELAVSFGADLALGGGESEVVLTRFLVAAPRPEVGSGLGTELAEMAASMMSLQHLAAEVERRGGVCSVLSQFSDDPPAALLAQAEVIDADVVVFPSRVESGSLLPLGPAAQALFDEGTIDTALLALPAPAIGADTGRPVVIVLDDDVRDAVGVELGVRVARSRGVGVVFTEVGGERRTARRTAALAREVDRLGIECTVRSDGMGAALRAAGLVVISVGTAWTPGAGLGTEAARAISDASSPVLVVRPAETLSPVNASTRIRGLATSRGSTGANPSAREA